MLVNDINYGADVIILMRTASCPVNVVNGNVNVRAPISVLRFMKRSHISCLYMLNF